MKSDIITVLSTIVFNDRLKKYQYYIEYARNKGYEVVSLEEFFRLSDKKNGKHFILRHDVDVSGPSVRKMFELENKIKCKSTYYFRFSTIDKELIQEMFDNGFGVGFHFETISDYIKENGYVDKNQIDIELMRLRLKQDIQKFEETIGHKIFSCCSHGAAENIKIGMSNNTITETADMRDFDIEFEAYSKSLYEYVDCHIMDQDIVYNFGFSYADTPISAIDNGYNNILFLSHPNHWYYTYYERLRRMRTVAVGRAKFKEATREFVRIKG